ncbi:MAG TPA: hypothetical protein VHE34_06430 [Puia sp.]|uniref:hypothetical protein n=1 Tax=Puia sp. TaxID=2045100 RepID=UPI002C11584C|nr:hypothetical protein [Puia sp.]HVU94841.1 hypothetical protein [Puia sp.]
MKPTFVLITTLAILSTTAIAQTPRHIALKRAKLNTEVAEVTDATADLALQVASYLFSSKEFQDTLAKLNFQYPNHCDGCGKGPDRPERIPGTTILNDLFKRPEVALTLNLKTMGRRPRKNHCYGLGATCPNTDLITSYYLNIDCDMGEDFPFPYGYGVHLCHEYMHNIGYCHTDHDDDVAEDVGWIAYYYIKKWYQEHRKGLPGIAAQ